jgi:hypothetical protein
MAVCAREGNRPALRGAHVGGTARANHAEHLGPGCVREGDATSDRSISYPRIHLSSIKAFAGPEYEEAIYHPEDKKFLLKLNLRVTHYEVLVDPVQ